MTITTFEVYCNEEIYSFTVVRDPAVQLCRRAERAEFGGAGHSFTDFGGVRHSYTEFGGIRHSCTEFGEVRAASAEYRRI